MAFDESSKLETFPPFPDEEIEGYLEAREKGKTDYEGLTRSKLRRIQGSLSVASETENTDFTQHESGGEDGGVR